VRQRHLSPSKKIRGERGGGLNRRPVGWAGGEEGRGGDRHALLTSLSLSPILSDDILDSIKPALKFEGALL
jgi:hypothetical protein